MTVATWVPPGAVQRHRILREVRSVAVVGASADPSRPSYFVATYLLASTDYDVYFVNPRVTEILGHPCHQSLQDLPVRPDLVDVFRRPADLDTVLDEAIEVGASVYWTQLGLVDAEVAGRGVASGLDVVMDRCLKIEHARFDGGLHLGGFDTGVITSRRRRRRDR